MAGGIAGTAGSQETDEPEPQPDDGEKEPTDSPAPTDDGADLTPAVATCTGCGAPVDETIAFCTSCGTPTGPTKIPVTAPIPVVVAPLQEPPTIEAVSDDTTGNEPGSPLGVSEPEMAGSTTPCVNCGEALEPDAAFCISCGTPTVGVVAVVDNPDSGDEGRSGRAILLGSLAALVILLAAAGAWFMWGNGNATEPDDAADAQETQETQQTASTVPEESLSDPDTSSDAAGGCVDIAQAAADIVSEFAEGFRGSSVRSLALNARIGSDLLPGIANFNGSTASLQSQAASQGCEESSLQTAYSDALAGEVDSSAAIVALVESAFAGSQFGRPDPVDAISATLLLFPLGDSITTGTALPLVDAPKWVVLLASMNASDVTSADAAARADGFTASGVPADFLLTDPYASLNPGYWAVFSGPFVDQDAAKNYCLSIRDQVPDCYQRYVQTLPTTDPPYGRCGPYGMIDIKGVAADEALVLTGWPEDGRGNVGTLAGTATGILVAGPTVFADGQWTPVAYGTKIGWLRNEFTADNATCPRTVPTVTARSCVDIANATLEVFKTIAEEASALELTGDLSLAAGRSATNDAAIADLVRDADAAGCSAVQLNALLATGRTGIPSEGALAPLVVRVLYADAFFVDG